MDPNTESVLLARAQDGDYAAFDQLVTQEQVRLFRICLAILHDQDLAEHTALVAVERAWWAIGTCRGSFRAWLVTIARHQALDVLAKADYRRTAPWPPDPEPPAHGRTRDAFDETLIHQHDLAAAVSRLPVQYRAVIELRYYGGLNWNDVATVLGTNAAKARQDHQRAKNTLRKLLGPDYLR